VRENGMEWGLYSSGIWDNGGWFGRGECVFVRYLIGLFTPPVSDLCSTAAPFGFFAATPPREFGRE